MILMIASKYLRKSIKKKKEYKTISYIHVHDDMM